MFGSLVQGGFSKPEWNGKAVSGQMIIDLEGLTATPPGSPTTRYYLTSIDDNAGDWLSFTLNNPDGNSYSFPGEYSFPDELDPFSQDYVNGSSVWLRHQQDGMDTNFFAGRTLLNPDSQLKRGIYLQLEARGQGASGLTGGLNLETINPQFANWFNYGLVNYATNDGTSFDYYFTIDTIKQVPEPSSLALLLCGTAALLWARRRRAWPD